MAKKKAVSKKKVKKKVSRKKVASKVSATRRQVNVMLDEKTIKKLDKVRAKHGATRSDLIIKLVKSAS